MWLTVSLLSLLCSFENSVTEEIHTNWLKNWNILLFRTHYLLWMIKERKYKNNPYEGKKRRTWNKPTEPFPNKWKWKLAKSDKGLNYNQGKWINEHEYRKGRYYSITSQKTSLLFRKFSRRKKLAWYNNNKLSQSTY